MTAARSRSSGDRELEVFLNRAVAKAKALAGPLLDVEDLEQAARLALLEAKSKALRFGRAGRTPFIRRRVIDALKTEIRTFASPADDQVTIDAILQEIEEVDDVGTDQAGSHLSLVWDGETSDELVAKVEETTHVRAVVGGMPDDTAQVVRLCFGLDGSDAVDPIDVADILDESPEAVLGHLWAAEKLFRHFSADGNDRRFARLTALEFEAFHEVGDLAWYDLRDVNLNNRDLRGCDLSHAVMSGMNLWGLVLAGTTATGVNLWGSQLDGANLEEADLAGANLERVVARLVRLGRARLPGANLWAADLTDAAADHADLSSADLRAANLSGADLTRANLSGADLRGANLRGAKLVGADLQAANLQHADLTNTDFRWANFTNSDLCWANLSSADLTGATVSRAIRSPKLNQLNQMWATRAPRPTRLRPEVNPVAEPA